MQTGSPPPFVRSVASPASLELSAELASVSAERTHTDAPNGDRFVREAGPTSAANETAYVTSVSATCAS